MDGSGKKLASSKITSKPLTQIQKLGKLYHLRKSFLKKHQKDLPNFHHRITSEVFEDLSKQWFEDTPSTLSLQHRMYKVGFKRKYSILMSKYANELLAYDSSYTTSQIFDIIIQYTIGNYKPLTRPSANFFLNNKQINEFSIILNDDKKDFLMYNFSSNDSHTISSCIKLYETKKKSGYKLFYHCSNWSSAKSIIDLGINHQFGRMCLDFGILRSFYMTPDINTAVQWGLKQKYFWSNEICIIIVQIPDHYLDNNNTINSNNNIFKIRSFKKADSDWVKYVTSSRQCMTKKNDLDTYDFVYGPMCSNPEVKNNLDIPKTHRGKDIKFQLASKKDSSDAFMTDNILGLIWFDKQQILH
jgi:hypothetical protein